MLEAYFDDSGNGQEPVFVLAGLLSPAESWAAFTQDWQAELDRQPTLACFKMKEAMHGAGVWRQMREDARHRRLDRFRAIFHKHVSIGFACVVRHDAFNHLIRDRLNVPLTVYLASFIGVIGAAMHYHRQSGWSDKVDFVFDRQIHEFDQASAAIMRVRETDPYLLSWNTSPAHRWRRPITSCCRCKRRTTWHGRCADTTRIRRIWRQRGA